MTRALLVVVVALTSLGAVDDSPSLTAIRVDQVGYAAGTPKLAMIVSDAATGAFSVVRASDSASVLTGTLGPAKRDADSGDLIRVADFSAVDADGTYVLDVAGVGR